MGKPKVESIKILKTLPAGDRPFLSYHRLEVCNQYEDGSQSRPYHTEFIDRRGFDAIAMAVFHEKDDVLHMGVIQGVRPAMILRRDKALAIKENHTRLYMPEAVAGSVDPEDKGKEGLIRRAVAEIEEEGGFSVSPEDILSLGAGYFPSHGQCTEKIFLCAARVDPDQQKEAAGDGSVNEGDSLALQFVPHLVILERCLKGEYEDPKLEILSYRLALLTGHQPWGNAGGVSPEDQEIACRKLQAIQKENFLG